MRRASRMVILILSLLLLAMGSCQAEDGVFIRIERADQRGWDNPPGNLRVQLNEGMSGSAQFSENQFRYLAAMLRQFSNEVWIVDCRQESHGFLNGHAVSWLGLNNAANLGKNAKEVEAEEASYYSLVGTTTEAYTVKREQPKKRFELYVKKWKTERTLAEAEGLHYLRLACTDHCWPPKEAIDEFIDFAKNLDGDAWLHFHCQAGSGRTGTFMAIYEMMQKPYESVGKILRHQAEDGGGNLLVRSGQGRRHVEKERCVLIRAMHRYIRENSSSGYAVKWSDWLKAHSRVITMRVGERLEGKGFSSDRQVVSDSLEAVGAGQATVLVDDGVCFITVDKP